MARGAALAVLLFGLLGALRTARGERAWGAGGDPREGRGRTACEGAHGGGARGTPNPPTAPGPSGTRGAHAWPTPRGDGRAPLLQVSFRAGRDALRGPVSKSTRRERGGDPGGAGALRSCTPGAILRARARVGAPAPVPRALPPPWRAVPAAPCASGLNLDAAREPPRRGRGGKVGENTEPGTRCTSRWGSTRTRGPRQARGWGRETLVTQAVARVRQGTPWEGRAEKASSTGERAVGPPPTRPARPARSPAESRLAFLASCF